jgi:hypothetical protein
VSGNNNDEFKTDSEPGPIDSTPAVGHPDDSAITRPTDTSDGMTTISEPDDKDTVVPEPEPVLDPIELASAIVGGGAPKIPMPDRSEHYKSPVILPSSQASEILPGSAFGEKLKLDDKTLAQLGVTSEDDLGDDIDLERSPVDGACVVVSMKNGMPVCQYCFMPFAVGIPEFEPAEIQVAKPSGMEQGIRVKVHASCHVKRMQEISAGKRKS